MQDKMLPNKKSFNNFKSISLFRSNEIKIIKGIKIIDNFVSILGQ